MWHALHFNRLSVQFGSQLVHALLLMCLAWNGARATNGTKWRTHACVFLIYWIILYVLWSVSNCSKHVMQAWMEGRCIRLLHNSNKITNTGNAHPTTHVVHACMHSPLKHDIIKPISPCQPDYQGRQWLSWLTSFYISDALFIMVTIMRQGTQYKATGFIIVIYHRAAFISLCTIRLLHLSVCFIRLLHLSACSIRVQSMINIVLGNIMQHVRYQLVYHPSLQLLAHNQHNIP